MKKFFMRKVIPLFLVLLLLLSAGWGLSAFANEPDKPVDPDKPVGEAAEEKYPCNATI